MGTIELFTMHEGVLCATSMPLEDTPANDFLAKQEQFKYHQRGEKAWVIYKMNKNEQKDNDFRPRA